MEKFESREYNSHKAVSSHVYSRLTCHIPLKKLIADNYLQLASEKLIIILRTMNSSLCIKQLFLQAVILFFFSLFLFFFLLQQ